MAKSSTAFTLWPTAAYAEDQKSSRAILTTHVIYRGFQTGVAVALISAGTRSAFNRIRGRSPQAPLSVATAAPTSALATGTVHASLARSAGRSGLVTAAVFAVALPFYMYKVGGETAEDRDYAWKDRSYRLLYNEGQVSVDRWSIAGMAVGGVSALARGGLMASPLTAAGSIGLWSLTGTVGSMVWRGANPSRASGEKQA